ncbi:MAG: DUF4230 domain-containing protein [Blastocatellia bacterium]
MAKSNKSNVWKVLPWVLFGFSLIVIFTVIWKNSLFTFFDVEKLNSTRVEQSVVIEKIQKVAKLVTSEVTLRDVMVYENTWYGSTKRSLTVITAKVLAGVNLESGASVNIDEQSKKITITLPQPTILSTEITDIKTYDEQSGLWNPFKVEDKDKIFRLAREKINSTANELSLTKSSQQNLTELLQTMFQTNGYSVEIIYRQPPLLKG